MSSAGSPAVPAFSYAQAAQGLTRNSQSQLKSPASSSGASDTNTKEAKSATNEPAKLDLNATQSSAKSSRNASSSRVTNGTDELLASRTEAETTSVVPTGEPTASANPGTSSSTVVSHQPTHTTHQNTPEEQYEAGNHTGETTDVSDSQVLTPAGSDKFSVVGEKKKSRDEDGEWEHLHSPSIPAEKELKPAPAPVVNFWTQRKAEQEARARDLAFQRASGAGTTAKGSAAGQGVTEAAKTKVVEKVTVPTDRDTAGGRRKDPEGSRSVENGMWISSRLVKGLF